MKPAETNPLSRRDMEALSRKMTEDGMLIAAGWVGFRMAAIPSDAPKIQLEEMRNAFFAGAQHLFSSIMTIMEPGVEPTDADLTRMTLIQGELDAFLEDHCRRHGLPMPERRGTPQ